MRQPTAVSTAHDDDAMRKADCDPATRFLDLVLKIQRPREAAAEGKRLDVEPRQASAILVFYA